MPTSASKLARLYLAKTFQVEVGQPIWYGKYKNKKGVIKEFKENEKGDTIVVIEQLPNPTGRKQPKEMKLFKIRPRNPEEKQGSQRVAEAWAQREAARKLFWHGTATKNLRGILKQGLIPTGQKVFTEEVGQAGQRSLKTFGGIYFTDNWMSAYSAATKASHTAMGVQSGPVKTKVMVGATLETRSPSALPDEDDVLPLVERINGKAYADLRMQRTLWAPLWPAETQTGWSVEGEFNPQGLPAAAETIRSADISKGVDQFMDAVLQQNPAAARGYKTRKPQVDAAVARLLRAHAAHLMENEILTYRDPRIEKVERLIAKAPDFYKDDPEALADSLRAHQQMLKAIKEPPPMFEGTWGELAAATEAVSSLLPELREPTPGGFRNNVRLMEPVTYRGQNRILMVVELVEPASKDDWRFRDIVFHYGAEHHAVFVKEYRQHVGQTYRVLNRQGKVLDWSLPSGTEWPEHLWGPAPRQVAASSSRVALGYKRAAETEQLKNLSAVLDGFGEGLRLASRVFSGWTRQVLQPEDQAEARRLIQSFGPKLLELLNIEVEDPFKEESLAAFLRRAKNLAKLVRQITDASKLEWDAFIQVLEDLGSRSKSTWHKYLEYSRELKGLVRTLDAEVEATLEAGGFHLVLYRMGLSDWTEETVGRLKWVMNEASKRVGKVGLPQIAGGTVFCFPTANVPGRHAVAWYRRTDDVMTVAAGSSFGVKQSPQEVLYTVVHELGHRAYYRVMGNQGRAAWEEFFEMSKGVPDVGKMISDWKSWADAAGRERDVATRRHFLYYYQHLKKEDWTASQWLRIVVESLALNREEKFDARHNLPTPSSQAALDELEKRAGEVKVFMHPVTAYSATSAAELFAEVFAHYVLHGPRTLVGVVKDAFRRALPQARVGSGMDAGACQAEHGYAWVSPEGRVHPLSQSHYGWAVDYLDAHPGMAQKLGWEGGISAFTNHGWIRVANATNISTGPLTVVPRQAWKAVADLQLDCVRAGILKPDDTVYIDLDDRAVRLTVGEFARKFVGRQQEDLVYEAALR